MPVCRGAHNKECASIDNTARSKGGDDFFPFAKDHNQSEEEAVGREGNKRGGGGEGPNEHA